MSILAAKISHSGSVPLSASTALLSCSCSEYNLQQISTAAANVTATTPRKRSDYDATTWKCSECKLVFSVFNVQNYVMHVYEHLELTGEFMKCPSASCNEAYPNSSLMMQHIKQQHDFNSCPDCPARYISAWQLEKHWRLRHDADDNGISASTAADTARLKEKVSRHTASSERAEVEASQVIRTSSVLQFQSLDSGIASLNSEVSIAGDSDGQLNLDDGISRSSEGSNQINGPSAAGKSGALVSGYVKEGNTLEEQHVYQCPYCLCKPYSKASGCNRHIKSHHSSAMVPAMCPICVCGPFANAPALLEHVRNQHVTNLLPYKCLYCTSRFVSQRTLIRHIQQLHAEIFEELSTFSHEMIEKTFSNGGDIPMSSYLRVAERLNASDSSVDAATRREAVERVSQLLTSTSSHPLTQADSVKAAVIEATAPTSIALSDDSELDADETTKSVQYRCPDCRKQFESLIYCMYHLKETGHLSLPDNVYEIDGMVESIDTACSISGERVDSTRLLSFLQVFTPHGKSVTSAISSQRDVIGSTSPTAFGVIDLEQCSMNQGDSNNEVHVDYDGIVCMPCASSFIVRAIADEGCDDPEVSQRLALKGSQCQGQSQSQSPGEVQVLGDQCQGQVQGQGEGEGEGDFQCQATSECDSNSFGSASDSNSDSDGDSDGDKECDNWLDVDSEDEESANSATMHDTQLDTANFASSVAPFLFTSKKTDGTLGDNAPLPCMTRFVEVCLNSTVETNFAPKSPAVGARSVPMESLADSFSLGIPDAGVVLESAVAAGTPAHVPIASNDRTELTLTAFNQAYGVISIVSSPPLASDSQFLLEPLTVPAIYESSHCAQKSFTDLAKLSPIVTGNHTYYCSICMRSFKKSEALAMHVKAKHTSSCPHCMLSLTDPIALAMHVQDKHTFSCSHCMLMLASPIALAMHIQNKHTFTCLHCKLSLTDPNALDMHVQENHTFRCLHCKLSLADLVTLTLHIRDEHTFRCSHCKLSLADPIALDMHIKNKHNFNCPLGPFLNAVDLDMHIKNGHNVRCVYCPVGPFLNAVDLDMHIQYEHNLRCAYCHRGPFFNGVDLDMHIQYEHNLRCPHCHLGPFFSEVELDRHIDDRHPEVFLHLCGNRQDLYGKKKILRKQLRSSARNTMNSSVFSDNTTSVKTTNSVSITTAEGNSFGTSSVMEITVPPPNELRCPYCINRSPFKCNAARDQHIKDKHTHRAVEATDNGFVDEKPITADRISIVTESKPTPVTRAGTGAGTGAGTRAGTGAEIKTAAVTGAGTETEAVTWTGIKAVEGTGVTKGVGTGAGTGTGTGTEAGAETGAWTGAEVEAGAGAEAEAGAGTGMPSKRVGASTSYFTGKTPSTRTILRCPTCGESFELSSGQLIAHLRESGHLNIPGGLLSSKTLKDITRECFAQVPMMIVPENQHGASTKCTDCNETFRSWGPMQKHLRKAHVHVCNICSKNFHGLTSFQLHNSTKHDSSQNRWQD